MLDRNDVAADTLHIKALLSMIYVCCAAACLIVRIRKRVRYRHQSKQPSRKYSHDENEMPSDVGNDNRVDDQETRKRTSHTVGTRIATASCQTDFPPAGKFSIDALRQPAVVFVVQGLFLLLMASFGLLCYQVYILIYNSLPSLVTSAAYVLLGAVTGAVVGTGVVFVVAVEKESKYNAASELRRQEPGNRVMAFMRAKWDTHKECIIKLLSMIPVVGIVLYDVVPVVVAVVIAAVVFAVFTVFAFALTPTWSNKHKKRAQRAAWKRVCDTLAKIESQKRSVIESKSKDASTQTTNSDMIILCQAVETLVPCIILCLIFCFLCAIPYAGVVVACVFLLYFVACVAGSFVCYAFVAIHGEDKEIITEAVIKAVMLAAAFCIVLIVAVFAIPFDSDSCAALCMSVIVSVLVVATLTKNNHSKRRKITCKPKRKLNGEDIVIREHTDATQQVETEERSSGRDNIYVEGDGNVIINISKQFEGTVEAHTSSDTESDSE